ERGAMSSGETARAIGSCLRGIVGLLRGRRYSTAASADQFLNAARWAATFLAASFENATGLNAIDGGIVSEAEGLEVALAQLQRQSHPLRRTERGKPRTLFGLQPIRDAAHGATII